MNMVSRPCSGDRKDRSVVSLNSEVFVWGGGKYNPIKIEQFKETDCALQVATGRSHFAVLTIERDLYTWTNIQGNTKLSGSVFVQFIETKIPMIIIIWNSSQALGKLASKPWNQY